MSSDTENDLFNEQSSPAQAAPSPAKSARSDTAKSEGNNEEDPHDLFGGDDEDNVHANPPRSRSTTPGASSGRGSRQGSPNPLEYAESDAEVEDVHEQWASLPVPTWPRMHPTDGKVWHLKLPAYVNLEHRPYEADYYRSTIEGGDDELRGSAAKGRMIGVRNTMRWRWVTGPDGQPQKQANARMLRWSDGSVSVQIGSEMFDLAPSYGTTLAREQDAAKEEGKKDAKTGSAETSFVCVAAPNEQVLVTETAIEGQVSLVPTSMDSKTHRELVKHVGQQHVKHSRMKILNDEADEQRLKELLARAGPQRPAVTTKKSTRRAPGQGGVRAGGGFGRRGAFGRATKRADSEESDIDLGEAKPKGGYDEDDGFVVADSDESDDDTYRRKKKKSKRNHEDMDETELADARIEAREREKKRAKTKRSRAYSDDDSDDDAAGEPADEEEEEDEDAEMEMDVESEEE